MPSGTLNEMRIKKLLKSAVTEVLEERQDLVRAALAEALEDLAMTRAIHEGLRTPKVSRGRVTRILAGE